MREQVIRALCVQFASDHLSMKELEQRLDEAYRAQSTTALAALVDDLPAPKEGFDPGPVAALAPADAVSPRGLLVAVMGGGGRSGSWIVPRHLKIVAVMGGAEVDLREARFTPGVTEIEVLTLMGGVEIIVPPGVRVDILGVGVMGGFDSNAGDATALDVSRPVLRVTGLAVMGGVGVVRREPGRRSLRKFEKAWRLARRLAAPALARGSNQSD